MSVDLSELSSLWQSDLLSSLPGVLTASRDASPGWARADGNVGFSAPRDREDAWAMRQLGALPPASMPDTWSRSVRFTAPMSTCVSATDAGRGARPGSRRSVWAMHW